MSAPSLQKTAAVSAALHLAIFFLSFIVLKHTSQMHLPSPYVVRLVDMRSVSQKNAGSPAKKAVSPVKESAPAKDTVKPEKKAAVVKEPLMPAEKGPQKKSKPDKIDEQRIEDSLEAIRAKNNIKKIVALRSMISIGKTPGRDNSKTPSNAFDNAAGTVGEATYIDKIYEEISNVWACPDIGEKSLEAIVAVRIMRDGTIEMQAIEKKSGNRLFDRCVLEAISLASPVSPPPYEMEIGIRFYP
jgi:outer membrane biosynthesis protein TonB